MTETETVRPTMEKWLVLYDCFDWWPVEVPPMTGPPLPAKALVLCPVCSKNVRVKGSYRD